MSVAVYRARWAPEKYRGRLNIRRRLDDTIAEITSPAVRYVWRRLGHAVLVLVGVSFLTFVLAAAAPGRFGDELRLDPRISPATIEAMKGRYGVNEAVPGQYLRMLQSDARARSM